MTLTATDLHSLKLESRNHPGRAIVRDVGSLRITALYALPPRTREDELVVPEFAWFYMAQERLHPEDGDDALSEPTNLSEDEALYLLSGRSLDELAQRRDGQAEALWARVAANRAPIQPPRGRS